MRSPHGCCGFRHPQLVPRSVEHEMGHASLSLFWWYRWTGIGAFRTRLDARRVPCGPVQRSQKLSRCCLLKTHLKWTQTR